MTAYKNFNAIDGCAVFVVKLYVKHCLFTRWHWRRKRWWIQVTDSKWVFCLIQRQVMLC